MKLDRLVRGLVLFVLVLAFGLWGRACVRIDSCLDRGGAWDYKMDSCNSGGP